MWISIYIDNKQRELIQVTFNIKNCKFNNSKNWMKHKCDMKKFQRHTCLPMTSYYLPPTKQWNISISKDPSSIPWWNNMWTVPTTCKIQEEDIMITLNLAISNQFSYFHY